MWHQINFYVWNVHGSLEVVRGVESGNHIKYKEYILYDFQIDFLINTIWNTKWQNIYDLAANKLFCSKCPWHEVVRGVGEHFVES